MSNRPVFHKNLPRRNNFRKELKESGYQAKRVQVGLQFLRALRPGDNLKMYEFPVNSLQNFLKRAMFSDEATSHFRCIHIATIFEFGEHEFCHD